MAEETTAVEADDGAQVIDVEEEQHTEETPEAIANLARDLGWVPPEEWQGEPDKHKSAEQFIRDGRDIQQTTARELRSVREQIERLSGVTTQIVTDKVAERDAYWQSKLDQAVEDNDKEAVHALLKERPAPAAQPNGPDPIVEQWKAQNGWFNSDPLAQARAKEISDRLAHLPVPDQLKQVERAIRKEFPEHFPQAKPPPSTQTGANRNPRPSNREKGFADMPQASQQVALDYEKRLGVPKEQTAKSYWADQERVSR